MMEKKLPLNVVHEDKLVTAINRAHIFFHSFLVSLFLYLRLSHIFLLLTQNDAVYAPPLFASLLLFVAEFGLSLFWLSEQAFRWRIVDRAVFIDRLPGDDSVLPAVDVFICTADPDKEPTVEVMNTVLSAMALDYPPDKVHVYLSDDGGAHVTLAAMREAWGFATWWVPFCRTYGVECRCPMAYFNGQDGAAKFSSTAEYIRDKLLIKEKYELFKQRVEENRVQKKGAIDEKLINPDHSGGIPLLVYVAREKRLFHPHHFKAGALNVLLRVSGLLSNSPIVLVLDCDMYCNDPTSAKQAMCFYLDPKISPSLGFVQFPQRFHNLSKHPIGCVKDLDPIELRKTFGPSNEFITTRSQPKGAIVGQISQKTQKEAEFLASCSYEEETKWGNELGFYYYSVAEDVFTGYNLHIRGWKSIYLNTEKAPFLGSSTTNLNDLLTQSSRWTAGLFEVGVSRYCPWIYGPSRRHLSLLHRTCYAWMDMSYINFISVWCLAIVPQLCLIHGIPVYSKASSSLFPLLASIIFFSFQTKQLHEALTTGGTIASWWNEQRTWIIKMSTSYTYGCIDAIMKILGLKNTSFIPTNKVIDDDQAKRYHHGLYDFQTSSMFLVPIGTIVILNLICFLGGLVKTTVVGNWDEMALQEVLSGFFLVMSKPVIEGMIVRKDKGKFPTSATLKSIVVCLILLVLGPLILLY
ncbi:hypothetical protein V2J09_015810 [Rumex salicifolius]